MSLIQPTKLKKIFKVKNTGEISQLEDLVAVETKIKLLINDQEILSLSATPMHLKELVVGFILTENLIKDSWCPEELEFVEKNDELIVKIYTYEKGDLPSKTLTSGCFASYSFLNEIPPYQTFDFKVDIQSIFNSFKTFVRMAELFKTTGGFHSAALCDQENLLFFTEDIGRHNAVDKVLGYALLRRLSLEDKLILVSGRVSSDMVLKVGRWRIPFLISRSAPTSLAVELAEKIGLTLIGFLRGERFNVYSHPQRIKNLENMGG
ncbi:formate dehydrogenase accessory sulfurtransferase FdhD [Thermodesulfobacterium sp. TA1]|uniref:formate dehydrogenase accessory sulfurtransferase FdhD n=1 Tax=Thermodesulfobacterium sp. TA1 TaxID=2234087 RepID=UPI001232B5D6|nr:formate dehydrogenase accessory sulfurtransferase FdhD [Thermodesulfobacterium sp. TA1]QER41808.1 formate dehydrogenase accessory sulfurtransferase FdhD [Thermodesulfobacterium sp. TA1]